MEKNPNNEIFFDNLEKIIEFDETLTAVERVFAYGTSGLRYNEDELEKVNKSLTFPDFRPSNSSNLPTFPIPPRITTRHNDHSIT